MNEDLYGRTLNDQLRIANERSNAPLANIQALARGREWRRLLRLAEQTAQGPNNTFSNIAGGTSWRRFLSGLGGFSDERWQQKEGIDPKQPILHDNADADGAARHAGADQHACRSVGSRVSASSPAMSCRNCCSTTSRCRCRTTRRSAAPAPRQRQHQHQSLRRPDARSQHREIRPGGKRHAQHGGLNR
jgi:hypothetical protein